jgi:photosystem II stability/assembly factor-like uncharacterized protein
MPYVWAPVTITGGGFVTGIVPHPAERNLIYARTDVGGAYRYDPASHRWVPITDWIHGDEWTLTGIESIALDPGDPERVYLAAGSYTNDWSGNGSILRSADRGETWEITRMPFKFGANEAGRSNGERLAVDPLSPGILYLGTRKNGLWRSADRGATWSEVTSFSTPEDTKGVGIVAVVFRPVAASSSKDASEKSPSSAPSAGSVIYAVVSSPSAPLWRSEDAGASWAPLPDQPLGLRPHHLKFGSDGWLYVTYSNEAGPGDVVGGAVWKHLPASGEWKNITPLKPSNEDRFGYAGLALDARNPGVLLVSTLCRWARHDELFRSVDGGATWKRVSPTATFDEDGVHFLRWGRPAADLGHWIGDIEIDPFNPDRAFYVTGMGIWGTDNLGALDRDKPTRWRARAHGIEETVVNSLVSPAGGAPLLSALWDIGGFRHEDLDVSPAPGFFQPYRNHNTSLDVAGLAPDFAVRVFSRGGAFSRDNGRTWVLFPSVPDGTEGNGRVAASAKGGSIVWTPQGRGAWFTRDLGKTWTASKGLPPKIEPVADRAAEGRFYAYDAKSGRLYSSSDYGLSFLEGALVAGGGEGRLVTVFGLPGHVWLARRDGLHRSHDFGRTFTKIPADVAGLQLGFGRHAPDARYPVLFLAGRRGGERGVFRSDDEGGTWTRINTDKLQFHSISALTGDPRVHGRVYIGTRGRGIFFGYPETSAP